MKIASEKELVRLFGFLKSRLQISAIDVEWKVWKDRRSNEQNAYLWRAVYQPLVEVAGFDKGAWHEHFCGEYWGWIEKPKPSGAVEHVPARTTTNPHVLSKEEFGKFVLWIESECANRGVFVEERWVR